jgi:hypothetical protein
LPSHLVWRWKTLRPGEPAVSMPAGVMVISESMSMMYVGLNPLTPLIWIISTLRCFLSSLASSVGRTCITFNVSIRVSSFFSAYA